MTRVEAGLEAVSGESRERVADTVPGKYQLAETDDREHHDTLSGSHNWSHPPII